MAVTRNVGCRRQKIQLLEITLDTCTHTFGQGACTATGTACYNNWNNCKDPCNFECGTQTYWFANCANVPDHILTNYTPNIISISTNASTLELGKAFSTRARIEVQMQDAPHTDQGFDPYLTTRGVIPICPEDKRGTLLGRWLERVKYFENRKAVIYRGYADQQLCEFRKETYLIDDVKGPTDGGIVTWVLKDPLTLAEDDSAKCPRVEPKTVATQVVGNEFPKPFVLGLALDGGESSGDEVAEPFANVGEYLLQNNYLAGDEDQDACFVRLKHICIGGEVLRVQPEINNATPRGWNFRLLDRAVCGSTLEAHGSGASISLVETIENTHVGDLICRLLTECSEIQQAAQECCPDDEEGFLDFDSIDQYKCDAPLNYVCEVLICKPVGLSTLINELSSQFFFFLFSDPATGKIKLKHFGPPACDAQVLVIDECEDTVEGSYVPTNTDTRYNQINIFHTTGDCSKTLASDNLIRANVAVTADATAEPCARREYKSRKIKETNSRWINECNTYMAKANSERLLMLKNCPTKRVSIIVGEQKANCFELGDFAILHHSKLQNFEGGFLEDKWLVKGIAPQDDGCVKMSFERTGFDDNTAPYLNCDTACPTLAIVPDNCKRDDCVSLW